MTDRLRLGVIFGGRSGEHAVSLMSARSVLNTLDRDKYDVTMIGIDPSGHWYTGDDALQALETKHWSGLSRAVLPGEPGEGGLYQWEASGHLELLAELDVVFPVLHGTFGEDGTIQGLLEMADVAYVGAGVLASALAMDKGVFKDLMKVHGVPQVDYRVLETSTFGDRMEDVLDVAESIGSYPLFTKPANLGSSVGVSKVRSRSDLLEGLMDAAQYDRRVIVEQGIDAREIEVSVLGNEDPRASVPGEVIPGDEFYSYRAKYQDETSTLHIPATIGEEAGHTVQDLAVRAFKAIDGAGMARVDFLMDKVTGEVFLNELNTIPGFTEISMYPKLWEASGLPYRQLCDSLLELALERKAAKDGLVRSYGSEA